MRSIKLVSGSLISEARDRTSLLSDIVGRLRGHSDPGLSAAPASDTTACAIRA
jgi:hypothetical protein